MRQSPSPARLAPGLLAGLAACAPGAGAAPEAVAAEPPRYQGVRAEVLDDGLVRIHVALSGAGTPQAVTDYADCAVAGHAIGNGYGFARHLRTILDESGGVWRADAVYTLSPVLPRGLRTIDTEVTVADCAEQGIPTV
ncbi:hypothetical protein [Pontitalea aquivivens]|uniref:hypothetical protein n=1 Tax=Pontitalea aquivivens TaxID=3388663 RepID=UPI003970A76D